MQGMNAVCINGGGRRGFRFENRDGEAFAEIPRKVATQVMRRLNPRVVLPDAGGKVEFSTAVETWNKVF